jgi:hypothetical protein
MRKMPIGTTFELRFIQWLFCFTYCYICTEGAVKITRSYKALYRLPMPSTHISTFNTLPRCCLLVDLRPRLSPATVHEGLPRHACRAWSGCLMLLTRFPERPESPWRTCSGRQHEPRRRWALEGAAPGRQRTAVRWGNGARGWHHFGEPMQSAWARMHR